MSRCARCDERLSRRATYCSNCGAPAGATAMPVPELDIDASDNGSRRSLATVEFTPRVRGRSVAIVGGLALAGLIVAVLVSGSSGTSHSQPKTTEPPSTIAVGTTSTIGTATAATTVPPITEPPTTATPTTVVQELGRLLPKPTGITLVVIDQDDSVRRIDLDTGRAETFPYKVTSSGGLMLAVGNAIVTSGNGQSVYLYQPDISHALTIPGAYMFPAVDPRQFWTIELDTSVGSPTKVHRFDDHGAELGDYKPLPSLIDGATVVDDSVLVAAGGNIYRFDPETGQSRRVTTGFLLGPIDGRHYNRVSVFSCDPNLRCSVQLVDGQGHVVSDQVSPPNLQRYGNQSLSPDGKLNLAVTYGTSGPSALTITDSVGAIVWERSLDREPDDGIRLDQTSNVAVWSPDSKWMFVPATDGVAAWSAETRQLIKIGLGPIGSFDVLESTP
jgi:hypothetical protein